MERDLWIGQVDGGVGIATIFVDADEDVDQRVVFELRAERLQFRRRVLPDAQQFVKRQRVDERLVALLFAAGRKDQPALSIAPNRRDNMVSVDEPPDIEVYTDDEDNNGEPPTNPTTRTPFDSRVVARPRSAASADPSIGS